MKGKWTLVMGAAALALGTAGNAAIYVKIPPIKGETSEAQDSGEAHLDYLIITMENVQKNRTTPFETEDIGAKATGGDDHSAGDEHEIEYDVSAGAFHETSDEGHKEWIDVLSWGAPKAAASARGARTVLRTRTRSMTVADAAKPVREGSSARASSHRRIEPVRAVETRPLAAGSETRVPVSKGPGSLRVGQPMEGCAVSSQYPYVLVGDDGVDGAEVKLEGVTVTECSSEHVSFNYEKISG